MCGIDSVSNGTWFAFNKLTGDFSCLTNFRTIRNRTEKRKYNSRGSLSLEFVKINDPTISESEKMKYEDWLSDLYNSQRRGFNLIFGNVFDQKDGKPGKIRLY